MKKNVQEALLDVADRLMCMAPAKGQRKATRTPRSEAVAVAYGIALGLYLAVDIERGELGSFPAAARHADPAEVATVVLASAVKEWPDHRDEMLSKSEDEASFATLVGVWDGDE